MIRPAMKDEALLADVAACGGRDGFHLWWLGQSGFLLHHAARFALIDPYLSDSLTTKYARTDKPHVRMTERCVDPRRLGFVDCVSSSHNHTDHFDPSTLDAILDANPSIPIVLPAANESIARARLAHAQAAIIGLNDGDSAAVGPFAFHAVAACHPTLERDAQGRCPCLGYVIRFGPHAMYHSGDTLRYPGLAERLAPFAVDLALLPINGDKPERRVAGNLDGPQAARLARDIGAKLVIPCHYEMFAFNTESPEAFERECRSIGQRHRILRCGERFDFNAE
jgi:L-ascorbate metabolism protein UlaG (beta-lactamase superfamily)